MIDKQSLETKLIGLEAQKEKLYADFNAVAGAVQLCKQLLTELEQSEQKVEEKAAKKEK